MNLKLNIVVEAKLRHQSKRTNRFDAALADPAAASCCNNCVEVPSDEEASIALVSCNVIGHA